MKALVTIILTSYRYNVVRCSLVFIALIVACSGLSSVLLINATAKASYTSASQPFLQNVQQRVVPRAGHTMTKGDYATLRRQGFNQLIAVAKSNQAFINPINGEQQWLSVMGIDVFALLSIPKQDIQAANESQLKNGTTDIRKLWQPPYQSLIHERYAAELNLNKDHAIILENGKALPRIAVTNVAGMGREILMDIAQYQQALSQPNLTELLVIHSQQSLNTIDQLRASLPSHLRIEEINTGEQANQLTASFHLNLLAMALLMFVVCMFVVMNALHLLLVKRWHNFRISRQLGISRKEIYITLGLELLVISLLCAPLGTLCGVQFAQWLSPHVSQTMQSLFDVRIEYTQVSYFSLMSQNFAACILGATIASLLPMWQLNNRLTMRTVPTDNTTTNTKWLHFSALLTGLSVVLAMISSSILLSFSAIAVLIFAGCCLLIYTLPRLLTVLFNYLPHQWILLRWLAADSIRLSSSSKIACCAFFIALASNVGMNLMVDSFRQATQDWLAHRLVADQYVYSQSPEHFIEWLEVEKIAVRVIPRKTIEAKLLSPFSNVNSNGNHATPMQLVSHATTHKYQRAILFAEASPDLWSEFNSGKGIVVNQQLALRNGLQLGDTVNIEIKPELKIYKQLVGIYYDYGNQIPEARLPLNSFERYTTHTSLFALHFSDKNQQQQFIEYFQRYPAIEDIRLISAEKLMSLSMKTFDRTFTITDSLNIVTLLVAAFSLATSVLMIDLDNRPQRALLRSMGVSKSQIGWMSLLQYTLISLFTCFVAIPFGVGLTWLLINLVNIQAFQWSYPMLVTGSKLITLCGLSICLILIVVALPLYITNHRKLAEDIKCLSFR